jgi:hypothetical protein
MAQYQHLPIYKLTYDILLRNGCDKGLPALQYDKKKGLIAGSGLFSFLR